MNIQLSDILQLSVSERIQLVGDIWDSIANEPKSFSLTDAQRAELDRRMEAYKQNPEAGLTLEELEQKFSQRAQKPIKQ